ncbi:MAG TPA: 5'-3' exonuclease H3TH domain-containing protein [Candidatus Absconditabacterales bacterium]|nr:5'-3' exonuclease H3TH domain-containing protein [Candidatus Absconditabacterales bacterium]HMT27044.1 5'-3' exonuclease H3TH domain-containing protein [Candidatus Absconditabacterales bacterium]
MKKAEILDGSGFLYRAFFAFPPLTNKNGENVNAVYGFFRLILKNIQTKPDFFLIARDAPTKTIRHEQYEDYKATRTKMPDDLKVQIKKIQELVNKLGIPNLTNPGYEADDIIATIAHGIVKEGDCEVFVVSCDKDLKQLLKPQITFKDPMKDEIVTEQSFFRENGYQAKNIVDYLSLVGDASDNIVGVPGIGKKTALDLIQKFGSVEAIYEDLDAISSSSVKEKLIAGKESCFHSKELIKWMEVPELASFDRAQLVNSFDPALWKKILIDEEGFTSLQKSLDETKKLYTGLQQVSLF